jgi:hypothetical protein
MEQDDLDGLEVGYVAIPGSEIGQLINDLAPIIEQYPRGHVIMAGLTLAVLCQTTNLTPPELHEIVMGASQYILSSIQLLNTPTPTAEIPKNLLN